MHAKHTASGRMSVYPCTAGSGTRACPISPLLQGMVDWR